MAGGMLNKAPRVTTVASVCIGVLALYWAREFIVPLVFAGLVASVLLPMASTLERRGMGRVPAVLVVTTAAYLGMIALAWIAAVQLISVVEMLPAYQANIKQKVAALGLERVTEFIEGVRNAPAEIAAARRPRQDQPPPIEPTPVRIVDPAGNLVLIQSILAPTLRPLAVMGFAAVVVIFLMLRWEDVRDRLIRLVSKGHITLTTRALDDLSSTISRVLRLQLAVNMGVGATVGVSLWALGVPKALLWGLLTGILRFIPYFGPVVSAAMPFLMAVAVSDGWSLPLSILAVYLLVDVATGNFVEPLVYGTRSGISTVAVLVSAAFWTWLWGLPGLLLAVPITVGLAVIGRHVPQLAFLDVLLGDAPVLAPPARLYQRLVAMDRDDAARMARAYQEEHGLEALYEGLVLPALREAEIDRHQGALDDVRAEAVFASLHELVENAAAIDGVLPSDGVRVKPDPDSVESPASPEEENRVLVVCIPARTQADEVAATMAAAVLIKGGQPARALSLMDMGGELASVLRQAGAGVVCIAAVPPYAARHGRVRKRQIELRAPGTPVVTAVFEPVAVTVANGLPQEAENGRRGGDLNRLAYLVERVKLAVANPAGIPAPASPR